MKTILGSGGRVGRRGEGFFIVVFLLGPWATSAATFGVPAPYSTIQAAISAASDGDTINVAAGTYVGPVDVAKSLVLLGPESGAPATIIPPSDFHDNPAYDFSLANFLSERPLVHIGSRSAAITVTFRGFTVDMQSMGPSFQSGGTEQIAYSGILADSCTVTIEGDTIRNVLPWDGVSIWESTKTYNGRGIHVRGSGAIAVIAGNYLEEIHRFYILVNAKDVEALPQNFPQATVTDNRIVGKGSYGSGQKGIWFNRGAWGVIANNTLTELDYTSPAIEPERASGIVTRFGYLNLMNRTLVYGNNVSASSAINNKGLYIQGHRDSVYGNTVTGYRWGIEVHSGGEAPVVPETTYVVNNIVSGGIVGINVSSEASAGTPDRVIIGGSPAGKNIITGQAHEDECGSAITLSFRHYTQADDFTSTIPVDARYNDFGVYTTEEVRERIFDRGDTTVAVAPLDTVLFYPFWVPKITANVKLFLQGPYNTSTDLMNNTLNTGGYLAAHFPGRLIPSLAVDSIRLELRDSVSASRSTKRLFAQAWLLTDGSVRDFADTAKAYVEFADSVSGYYHCVVSHRNHLAIMTPDSNSYEGEVDPVGWDFSTLQNRAYGTDPMKAVGTRFAMTSGDPSGNGQVQTSDINSFIRPNLGTSGYLGGDANLNGQVQNNDMNSFTRPNLGRGTQVPN